MLRLRQGARSRLIYLLALLFLIEFFVMVLLHELLDEMTFWASALFDATLVVVTALPLLWYFQVRPLKEAKTREAQQLRLLGAALHSAGNSIFITDRDGRIEWANDALVRASGHSMEELIGNRPSILKSGVQDKTYYQRLWQTILRGEIWSDETVERRKDGSTYTVLQSITPIRNDAGEITHFVAIHEDISARKAIEDHIRHLAHHDSLTGLTNRAFFYQQLEHHVQLAVRSGERLGLLYIDLDRFKPVNDRFGHEAGDTVLRAVAQRLKEAVRKTDLVARLGGDEFAVALLQVSEFDHADHVAAKIIQALGQPIAVEGESVAIGASIGIACYPADAADIDALVQAADTAMYAAKAAGRHCARRSSPAKSA